MHQLHFSAKQLYVNVSKAISLFMWNKEVINMLSEESAKRDVERHEELPVPHFGEECATLTSCKAAEGFWQPRAASCMLR